MTDEKTVRKDEQGLLDEIDLLLDNEAGGEGARLRAAIEADPDAEALFRFSQSIQLALQKGIPDPELPEGMWERFEVELRDEPLPDLSLLDRIHRLLYSFFQIAPRRWALQGSALLFLLTCGTLWWDGGAGFFPAPMPQVSERSAGRALDQILSDQLEHEAARALDQMLLDFTLDQSLRRAPLGDAGGDPAKRGTP